ncbi:ATP-binding cassette domain-containing protein [Mycolicibacterium sp. 624]|uniref:ABC transporter ATP-binding protein n=1 Tax=Mycolicibacterium sp. 624 TaxID=3156314 RepID=UPI003392652A
MIADTPALKAESIHKRFGGIHAVKGVSFEAARGSVLGVIGPNGSGKTATINLLSGAYKLDSGSISIGGHVATGRPAHEFVTWGVARTFQNPRVFKTLTVKENLVISVAHRRSGLSGGSLNQQIEKWLGCTGLTAFSGRVAQELSGGQQKLVEFARAMVHQPSVVLMDEPFAGVHPHVKAVLHEQISQHAVNDRTTFVIVSHEIPDLIKLSDRFVCMAGGEILTEGTPADVCGDARVIDAYLGTPVKAAS